MLPAGRDRGFQTRSGKLKSPAVHMTAFLCALHVDSIWLHKSLNVSRLFWGGLYAAFIMSGGCLCKFILQAMYSVLSKWGVILLHEILFRTAISTPP